MNRLTLVLPLTLFTATAGALADDAPKFQTTWDFRAIAPQLVVLNGKLTQDLPVPLSGGPWQCIREHVELTDGEKSWRGSFQCTYGDAMAIAMAQCKRFAPDHHESTIGLSGTRLSGSGDATIALKVECTTAARQ